MVIELYVCGGFPSSSSFPSHHLHLTSIDGFFTIRTKSPCLTLKSPLAIQFHLVTCIDSPVVAGATCPLHILLSPACCSIQALPWQRRNSPSEYISVIHGHPPPTESLFRRSKSSDPLVEGGRPPTGALLCFTI